MSETEPSPETQAPATRLPGTDPDDSFGTLPPALETRFVPDDSSIATRAPDASGYHDSAPQAFPGYALLDTLGEGGMGTVYKARQEGLNRLVALKVILSGRRAGPKDLIRFLAEAEAVASIRHPHVVQVHEYGEADGRPFLAMEYLPGGSLADRLKGGNRLDPREAAAMVSKLARAVQAAHEQGIVHRDLKPANVLFDAQDEPKVTDFGLAKRGKGVDLTQTQAVMGTPAYMSPEQAMGQTKFVGPPADVYAMGVILYECLVGTRPFDDTDTHLLLRKVIEEEPVRPRWHVPGVPRDLELIALKCLAKDPADRYETSGALADDIDRFAAGEPVTVRSPGSIERALRWAKRKPTKAAAYVLTVAVVLLLAFGASLAVLWRDAEGARRAETQSRKVAENALDGEKLARADVEIARDKLARVEYGRTMQLAQSQWRDNNVYATIAMLAGTRADLRGWEWGYSNRLFHGELLEFKGHTAYVTSVSWHPDGSRVATASTDGTVRIWDARTGSESIALSGHIGKLSSVAWSPDGSRIAAASFDKAARVWDSRTGEEQLTLKDYKGILFSISWSPDGSRIATTGDTRTARIWDARTGAELPALSGHVGGVISARWSPDGSRIATASRDRTVRIWDARTGAESIALRGTAETLNAVSWSPDGSRVAAAGADRMARVWDARSGLELLTLKGHTGPVNSVLWSPDGSRLGTGSGDATTRVWDARTGAELLVFKGHMETVNAVSWSPDGERLVTASQDKTARIWDAKGASDSLNLTGHTRLATAVCWSPDGGRVASSSYDSTARVWDARNGRELLALKGHAGAVTSVSWSPDGSRIATASSDKTAWVWDSGTGAVSVALKGHAGAVTSVSWSPDDSRIATGCEDGATKIWDARTGSELLTIKGHSTSRGDPASVTSVCWSPDGKQVASVGQNSAGWVWDSRTGAELLALKGHDGKMTSISWSPDGTRLATGGVDGNVWDARTGSELLEFKRILFNFRYFMVMSVCWSPDGKRIAIAGPDGPLRIWDARGGSELLTISEPTTYVTAASWSPDGTRLATASEDGTVRIRDLRTASAASSQGGEAKPKQAP